MLILGHAGITLGAATLAAGVVKGRGSAGLSWFASLSRWLDIRILVIGALLPDIIDKPVGRYFFRETFSNGRIFSHTLLFLVVIAAVGIIVYRFQQRTWMLALAAGTFTHLILDEMWNVPATLFWPFMGWSFAKTELAGWMTGMWEALFSNPKVYVPEITGLAVLLWLGVAVITRKNAGKFLRHGRID